MCCCCCCLFFAFKFDSAISFIHLFALRYKHTRTHTDTFVCKRFAFSIWILERSNCPKRRTNQINAVDVYVLMLLMLLVCAQMRFSLSAFWVPRKMPQNRFIFVSVSSTFPFHTDCCRICSGCLHLCACTRVANGVVWQQKTYSQLDGKFLLIHQTHSLLRNYMVCVPTAKEKMMKQ